MGAWERERLDRIPSPDDPPPRMTSHPYTGTPSQSYAHGQRPHGAYSFNAGDLLSQQVPIQAPQVYPQTHSYDGYYTSQQYPQPVFPPQSSYPSQNAYGFPQPANASFPQPSNPSQYPPSSTSQSQIQGTPNATGSTQYHSPRPQYYSAHSAPAATGSHNPLVQDPSMEPTANSTFGVQPPEFCRHNIDRREW